jgi:glycyl-radical enzyme activating protein
MDNSISGTIFDIQRFCLHDGPGIRTLIFFKGCPLRCIWCHNPESLCREKEFIYRAHKCVGCRACELVCDKGVHSFNGYKHLVDYKKCDKCGKCVEACCYEAVSILGYKVSIQEIMDSIRTDIPYYKTDGGVTLSGGEPMFQPDFAIALAMAIKSEGINLSMETCGYASSEQFEKIAPYIDLFLYDYKATDDAMHKEFTGVSNKLIIKNLDLLNSLGKKIVLRCPLIPNVNDSTEHLKGIAKMARLYPMIQKVEILPYHRMGETKRIQMGAAESLPEVGPATEVQKQKWLNQLKAFGCEAKGI